MLLDYTHNDVHSCTSTQPSLTPVIFRDWRITMQRSHSNSLMATPQWKHTHTNKECWPGAFGMGEKGEGGTSDVLQLNNIYSITLHGLRISEKKDYSHTESETERNKKVENMQRHNERQPGVWSTGRLPVWIQILTERFSMRDWESLSSPRCETTPEPSTNLVLPLNDWQYKARVLKAFLRC